MSAEDYLSHFGVKGMKWGVRKADPSANPKQPKGTLFFEKELKGGEKISIYKDPPLKFTQFLARRFPSVKEGMNSSHYLTFRDKDGKKIGNGTLFNLTKDELYVDWIGVKEKHRGKGYASAAMKGVLKYAQAEGLSKVKLDVPGNAPDARHIYEKLGFKMDGTHQGHPKDYWGGLSGMEINLSKVKHSDESEDEWEENFAEEFAEMLLEALGQKGGTMGQKDTVEDVLAHFGIKGMRWGVKKGEVKPSSDAAKSLDIKTRGKRGKVKTLSNAELQTAINRMQLEQNFKRLAVNDKPAVTRFISSTLLEVGKREVQSAVAKKVATTIAKKVVTGGLG